jgi:hypothetical protein
MGKCVFDKAWKGACGKPTLNNSDFCEEHDGLLCSRCDSVGEINQATHECEETSQFVCGTPLCDNCTHDHNHPSGNWFHHCTKETAIKQQEEQKAKKQQEEEDNSVKLWYSYYSDDRLKICKIMSDFLNCLPYPVLGRLGMRQFKKRDLFDYIIKEGRGCFNPKIVEDVIDFFFNKDYYNDIKD